MSCERQTTKKYTSRPGPPWPAAECIGQVKRGNDERMYIARSYPSGAKRWVLESIGSKGRSTGAGKKRAAAAAKAAKGVTKAAEKICHVPFRYAVVAFTLVEETPDNYHRKPFERYPTVKELKYMFEKGVKGTLEYGYGVSATPIKFHDGKITMRFTKFPDDAATREDFFDSIKGIMNSIDDDSNLSIKDKKTGHWYNWYSHLEKTY
jgi:hypothetical protein